jgi:hypothetical protein
MGLYKLLQKVRKENENHNKFDSDTKYSSINNPFAYTEYSCREDIQTD